MRIQASELPFFVTLAGSASLSAAARDLGITTAAVSRRLSQMEDPTRHRADHAQHAADAPDA